MMTSLSFRVLDWLAEEGSSPSCDGQGAECEEAHELLSMVKST